MSIFVETNKRSDEAEIMDDFSIEGSELRKTLDTLDVINNWLGGTKVTISGLKKILEDEDREKVYRIIDLGCGSGGILRQVADFGFKNGFNFNLMGVDANFNTIEYARELSSGYSNIEYVHCDIFSSKFQGFRYDVVLSTLFLHHFDEEQLVTLLSHILDHASVGMVVNDLHRHRAAYYLFKLFCLPISNRMVIDDGLTSVLKGFKRKELEELSEKINANFDINWKWAFRYLWILTKNK